MNPDTEIYHKINDPVYENFRQNIRDRESFNNNIKNIKLNDRIRIWRTTRDIEQDCKKALAKKEKRDKDKQKRIKKWLYCGWCRKKPGQTAE